MHIINTWELSLPSSFELSFIFVGVCECKGGKKGKERGAKVEINPTSVPFAVNLLFILLVFAARNGSAATAEECENLVAEM